MAVARKITSNLTIGAPMSLFNKSFGESLRALTATACLVLAASCSRSDSSEASVTIRITGSDTMVNLVQAWAENYKNKRPDVAVQVAGGGSGVGIAGLIDGILDIAASSREIEPGEVERATQHNGVKPSEFKVALDGLAIYTHRSNPIEQISIEELADIYGEGGTTLKWSQLGVQNPSCRSDEIIRVSRQNNSGTYVYFREALLGTSRELKMGSIDQSGSKDVVVLVSRTPCAIGYSGMAYVIPQVKRLKLSRKKGETPVEPSAQTAIDGTYALARPLYLFTREAPEGAVLEFIEWVLGEEGQKLVNDIGYVPVNDAPTDKTARAHAVAHQ
jgi:phosphate transport system substrate-binding protein